MKRLIKKYFARIPRTQWFIRVPRAIYNKWPWAGIVAFSLIFGLLMGCASTFKLTVDSTGKITSITASDVAVKYDPVKGTITAIPNRWFSTKIFSEIVKVLGL